MIKVCSLLVLLTSICLAAETEFFDNNWAPDPLFTLVSENPMSVEIVFSMHKMVIAEMEIDGVNMQIFGVPGILLPNDEGAPNLARTGRYIAVPQHAYAQATILDARTEVYRNIEVAPSPNIPFETDDSPLRYVKDMTIYGQNSYYPESPVSVSEPMKIRGVDVVILGITPFQYNPMTKELVVYKDIRVKVDFIGGSDHFGQDRLRSPFWEPILQGNILNYRSLPYIDFYAPERIAQRDGYEYIILVPDDPAFEAWADTIKRWRQLQGISCEVFTLSEIGGSDTLTIMNFLHNAYDTWDTPPAAFLLLSDYPSSGDNYGIPSPHHTYYSTYTCVTDNKYADVDGDNLPEMHHARICAQNEAQLSVMINKLLSYERDPYTAANFSNEPLVACGWQDDRWFQLCAEVIRGFLIHGLGKNPARQYCLGSPANPTPGGNWSTHPNTATVVQYFSDLGYIPENNPYDASWWNNGSAAGINAAINSGAFLVQHRDHGGITGWGEPSYNNSHLDGLTNTMLTTVFSTNCLTGKYDYWSECFMEKFHRIQYGALCGNAASEVSFSFVNDTYVWGIFDYLWQEFMPNYPMSEMTGHDDLRPCMAMTYGKYFLQSSDWPGSGGKVVTYMLFHHHGDAFTTLYSEIPQYLTVDHSPILSAGDTLFAVTANDSSVIALTIQGEIIGVAEGTGSPISIALPPQAPGDTMKVTITKANFYRYEQDVPIITGNYAYIVASGDTIDDMTGGNGNGTVNPGETIDYGVYAKNIGNQPAQQITGFITESDTFVVVSEDSSWYGDIQVDDSLLSNPYYNFAIASNCPHGHEIALTIEFHDKDDSIFISQRTLTIYAPLLTIEDLDIVNDDNNNGFLDPGETGDLIITLKNEGGQDAEDINSVLSQSSTYITINDSLASFGDIPIDSSIDNSSNPYSVTADINTPIGTNIDFTIHVTGANGYSDDIHFNLIIGTDGFDYVTHDCGNVKFTVTRYGALGYMSSSATLGAGFCYPKTSQSHLYYGGFAAGTDATYVVDRYYEGGSDDTDWKTTTSPDGMVRLYEPGPNNYDEYTTAQYDDSGHPSSRDLVCEQYSWAWDEPTADDFIITKFLLRNQGAATISNLYAALIMDWDISTYTSNQGGSEAARNLTWMYYSSPYVGIAILDPPRSVPAANLCLIDHEAYVYPNGGLPDHIQIQFMDGQIVNTQSDRPADWSTCNSAGPFTLTPGEEVVAAFAVVGGDNLSDLQAHADSAYARYWSGPGIEEQSLSLQTTGIQVYPVISRARPYTVQYGFAHATAMEIKVYDAVGRLLEHRRYEHLSGAGEISINLRSYAQGVYFLRIEAGDIIETSKIIWLK